jgi:hypothetical protein
MTRPMIRIHNQQTNEIIDREMTEIEFEEHINPKLEKPAYILELERQAALSTPIVSNDG